MKALSLTQPWASLLFCPDPTLRKCWETRGWSTSYRGKLAIHAAKGLADMTLRDLAALFIQYPFSKALASMYFMHPAELPRGVVLGTVDLVDIQPTATVRSRLSSIERAFGNYDDGRYAWQLASPVLFPEPIPARGALNLWNWTMPKGTAG